MLVRPLYSQKSGACWRNRLGQRVPIEIYIGRKRPIQYHREYIRGGYRFSERRKSEMVKERKLRLIRLKSPKVNPFKVESEISNLWPGKINNFIPEIMEEYALTRAINNFKNL